jgi:penicillin amidase
MLAAFDGNLLPESGPALLYGYFRRAIARALFEPITGTGAWAWIVGSDVTAVHAIVTRCLANVVATLDTAAEPPSGQPWDEVVPGALAAAWRQAITHGGANPVEWRWGNRHRTNAKHPLAGRFAEQASALNPPRVPMGGDADTIQAASYLWREVPDFDVVGLSVYRQAVDLAQLERASYVIPGGVSGVPGSAHYQDQLPLWQAHQRIPMHYAPADVEAAATTTLTLLTQVE